MNYPFKKRQGNSIRLSFAKKLMMKFGEVCYFETDQPSYKLQTAYWKVTDKYNDNKGVTWYVFSKYNLESNSWQPMGTGTKFNFHSEGKWYRAIPKRFTESRKVREARLETERRTAIILARVDKNKKINDSCQEFLKNTNDHRVTVSLPNCVDKLLTHKNYDSLTVTTRVVLKNGSDIVITNNEGDVNFIVVNTSLNKANKC